MNDYHEFLLQKRVTVPASGFTVAPEDINPKLFLFQNACVRRALQSGKFALFEERGLGKTIQEMEWAKWVVEHTGGKVLILAPLAVAFQHLEQAAEHGYPLKYCPTQSDIGDAKVVVTNYERLTHFDPALFTGVILDESSILKAFNGKTKRALFAAFQHTPFKLCASATPAPNDHLELGNHAEFLGVMPSNEMIARWFINDTMNAGTYRLKHHAAKDFWRWVTDWSACLSHPRDLGPEYDRAGYDLPPLHLHEHLVDTSDATRLRTFASGRLLTDGKPSSTELAKVKRESMRERIARAENIVSALSADEPVILWCDLNDEADALQAMFPTAIEVRGNHKPELKEERLRAFTRGDAKRIITKADIAGMGLNWQHCAVQVFSGINYSFERLYQALGRSYRYGQTREVHAHLIFSESEGNVIDILRRKQAEFAEMQAEMTEAIRTYGLFRDDARRALTTSIGDMPMMLPSWLYSKKVSA
jgi:hypothetical protein